MSIDLDWYAVVTEAQREEVAQRALRQIGVATYIPEYRSDVRRGRSRVSIRRKLFPGYVFVGLQREREPWLRMEDCSAVLGVVGFGSPPVPVCIPPEVIGDLRLGEWRGRRDETGLKAGIGARLPEKDPDPVFAGRTGRVVHVISDERIVVLFGGGRLNTPDAMVTRRLDELELV